MKLRAISVTELNEYVSRHISYDPILSSLKVVGEIADFKISSLGHVYFRLNDEQSSVSCVMFQSDYDAWIAQTGMALDNYDGEYVEISGRLSVYKTRGQYQIQAMAIDIKGQGQNKLEFERLKNKLEKEGLFSISHKKNLVKFPKVIGIITSAQGAALQDVLKVLRRRAPYVRVIVFPSVVQGKYAADSIVSNLIKAKSIKLDAIIVTRGGGAGEDLSAFNDERVIREVFDMPCPVISAVGHEIDTTLCDYVADVRMPTPSTAAEVVASDIRDMINMLDLMYEQASDRINKKIELQIQQLENYSPSNIRKKMKDRIQYKRVVLDAIGSKLHALSPLATLNRGYSIVEDDDGNILKFADIDKDDSISVRFCDGKIICKVDNKITNKQ